MSLDGAKPGTGREEEAEMTLQPTVANRNLGL